MKFTTVLFTFLGLLITVAALPLYARDGASGQALEERFVDENDPIFARYFESASEISERELSGEEVEPRQVAQVAKVAKLIVKGIMKIVDLIKGKLEQDKKKRGQWTNKMIGEFRNKYPKFNFVICASKHKTDFKGAQGKQWGHSHRELPVSFHKTVGFEIYWFKEGTFHLLGDGGWMNWAYAGALKSKSDKGKTLVFAAP